MSEMDKSHPVTQTLPPNDQPEKEALTIPLQEDLSSASVEEEVIVESSPNPGKWRYMVVLGCFIVHVLLGGFNRGYGVVYLQLQKRYNSSSAMTAGVGGLATALRMCAGPLATVISERIGGRLTVIIGGIIFGLGSVFSAFIPAVEVGMLTLGVMCGFGGALTYIPSLVTVGHYFTRGRATALGFATSGSGVGVFILPFLMQAIFDFYGYQGGMVIIGGLLFHTVIAGCLYRPLKLDQKPQIELQILNTDDTQSELQLLKTNDTQGELQVRKTDDTPRQLLILKTDNTQREKEPSNIIDQVSQENGAACSLIATESGMMDKAYKKTSYEREKSPAACMKPFLFIAKKLHLSLLRNRPYLSFFVSQAFCSGCYWPSHMFLPALATSVGHSSSSSMILLSLLGVTDVVGRLGGGALFDVPWVRRRRRAGYGILLIFTALTVLAWPASASNYPLLAVGIVLHGFAAGALVGLKGTMTGDFVGTRLLAGGLGLAVFSQGIGIITVPPIAGMIRDVTHSYTWSYVFLGVIGLIGAVVYFIGAVPRTCSQPEGSTGLEEPP